MRGRTFLIWLLGIIMGMNILILSGADSNGTQETSSAKYTDETVVDRIKTRMTKLSQEKIEIINPGNTNNEPNIKNITKRSIDSKPVKYCSNPIGLIYTNGDIYPVREKDVPSGKQEPVGIIFPKGVIHPIINGSISQTHIRTPMGVLCQNEPNIYPVPEWPPCFECEPEGVLYPDGIILRMPNDLSSGNNELIAILNRDGTVTPLNQTELGFIPDINEKYNILKNIPGAEAIGFKKLTPFEELTEAEAMTDYLFARQQFKKNVDAQARAKTEAIVTAQKAADATAALQAAEKLVLAAKTKFNIVSRGITAVPNTQLAVEKARSRAEAALAKATSALHSAERLTKNGTVVATNDNSPASDSSTTTTTKAAMQDDEEMETTTLEGSTGDSTTTEPSMDEAETTEAAMDEAETTEAAPEEP